jgi:putative transposase
VTPATIASWLGRLDEGGEGALVQTPEPVNRFPELVTSLVQQLKTTFPAMGKRRVADLVARCGIHLSVSTVGRMLKRPVAVPPSPPTSTPEESGSAADVAEAPAARSVTARAPGDAWNIDLSLVATSAGFWTPWIPWAAPPSWPFAWTVAAVVDHFSRKVVHVAVFPSAPTAEQMAGFLDEAVARAGAPPRFTVTDQGVQFKSEEFRAWCGRHGVKPRFGAVGKKGSIAVIERFWRTLKGECTRRIIVPFRQKTMLDVVVAYADWFNGERPHRGIDRATPDECYDAVTPAHQQLWLETRPRYPLPEDFKGEVLRVDASNLVLRLRHVDGLPHLPIVDLERAA